MSLVVRLFFSAILLCVFVSSSFAIGFLQLNRNGDSESELVQMLKNYSVFWPVDDKFLVKYLCQTSSPPGIWDEESGQCRIPEVEFEFEDVFPNDVEFCQALGWKWTGVCCHPYEWQIDENFLSNAARNVGIRDCNGNGRVSPYDICVVGDELFVEVGFNDSCRLIGAPHEDLKIKRLGLIGIFSGGSETEKFINIPGSNIPPWTHTAYFRGSLLRYTRSGGGGSPVFGPLVNNIHPYPGLEFRIYSGNNRNLLPTAEAALISTVFQFLGGNQSVRLETAIMAKGEVVNHDIVALVIRKLLRELAGTERPSCLIDPVMRGTVCHTLFPNTCCVWSYKSMLNNCSWYTNPDEDKRDFLYAFLDALNLLEKICAPGFLGSWEGSYESTLRRHWNMSYYVSASNGVHYISMSRLNPDYGMDFSNELAREKAQEAIEEIKNGGSIAKYNIESNPTWNGMRKYDGYSVYHMSMRPVGFCITDSDRIRLGFIGNCSRCNTSDCRTCCNYIKNRCLSWSGSMPPDISYFKNTSACRALFQN